MKGQLIIGLAIGSAFLSTEYRTNRATAQALLGEADCVMCHGDCPIGQHVAASSGYTLPSVWYRNGGTHSGNACIEGTCESKHGPNDCSGEGLLSLADYNGLREAIVSSDHHAIARFLNENPGRVIVNVERNAVQVKDCKDGYVAHFPIDAALRATLTD